MEKRGTEREGGISPKVVVSRLNNGLLVTTVRCDETTALIDMLFVVWTRRVQGTIDFVGAQIPPPLEGLLSGSYFGIPRLGRGRYFQRYSPGDRSDAAFGYQSTVATCC